MAPHFSSGKISIWFFSKWILGSYKTQTVNFKPMLCKYLHSNMLKTLMFFNIWRKNLKIQKWSSEIMSRLQKFSENNFKWWGLWCWKNHVHISSGYENICIWSSRRLLKTTLYTVVLWSSHELSRQYSLELEGCKFEFVMKVKIIEILYCKL